MKKRPNNKVERSSSELEKEKDREQADRKKARQSANLGGRGARERPAPKAAATAPKAKATAKAKVKSDKFDKTLTVVPIAPQARVSQPGSSRDTTNPKAQTLAVVPRPNHRGELVLR